MTAVTPDQLIDDMAPRRHDLLARSPALSYETEGWQATRRVPETGFTSDHR
jgi:hypothetical protein